MEEGHEEEGAKWRVKETWVGGRTVGEEVRT